MPRPLRPIDDGLIYHVINRGNNRQNVFHKEADFKAFLAALGELKERKPFQLYGYCLLDNHFHLLVRPTGDATISRIMQSLLVSHTQRYHRHYRSGGHVWQGRFKSPVIQNDEHLLAVAVTAPERRREAGETAQHGGAECEGPAQRRRPV